jgi:hypothetical protein
MRIEVDEKLVRLAKALGASRRRIVLAVIVRGSLPIALTVRGLVWPRRS